MARHYSRRSNGRFRRATLENTFGMKAWCCRRCNGLNPRDVGEGPPPSCSHCGDAPFRDAFEDFDAPDGVEADGRD